MYCLSGDTLVYLSFLSFYTHFKNFKDPDTGLDPAESVYIGRIRVFSDPDPDTCFPNIDPEKSLNIRIQITGKL